MAADVSGESLKWPDIWKLAFLHPNVRTFARIGSDRKVSIRWGLIWMALTACVAWLVGPLRLFVWGWLADVFGMQSPWPVTAVGAVAVPLWAAIALLFNASLAHGLARLFHGMGTLRKLVYCWGVLQPPFVVLALLVLSFNTSPYSTAHGVSSVGVVLLIAQLVAAAAALLYMAYAQVVAFAAVEGFSFWKGLGVILLLSLALGLISAWLSSALGRSLAYVF